jgi:hypothetical protein
VRKYVSGLQILERNWVPYEKRSPFHWEVCIWPPDLGEELGTL